MQIPNIRESPLSENKSFSRLKTSLHVIDRASEWAGRISSFLIFFMIGLIMWAIISRYFLNAPIKYELLAYTKFMPLYVALGGAYTLLYDAHVRTDVLYEHLSVWGKSIVDLCTVALFFTFAVMLLVYAIPDAADSIARMPHSLSVLNPLNWPVGLLVAIGVVLFFLQGIAKFIRDIYTAATGRESL